MDRVDLKIGVMVWSSEEIAGSLSQELAKEDVVLCGEL
jgi:hypothetical protein